MDYYQYLKSREHQRQYCKDLMKFIEQSGVLMLLGLRSRQARAGSKRLATIYWIYEILSEEL